LLAAVASERSRPRERRELHLALAGVVVDAELRARHLALAAEHPDPALAATVAAAADGAFLRSARGEAAELAEHALRLTPVGSGDRAKRVLALADFLDRAGEPRRATELLTPEVASMPAGAMRARAWLLLAGNAVESSEGLQHHLELALAECQDDPGLRASVLANKSANIAAGMVVRLGEAEAWALEALQAAPDAGPEVEREALYALAWPRALAGRPIDDLCERSRTASDISSYIAFAPERVAGQRLVWRGEMHQAREILTRYLLLADQRGEPSSYALQRLHVCELELRAGAWDPAARLLDEWAQSTDRDLLFWPMYERCRALLAAGRGLADEAERWATEAIARAEASGCEWDRLEALRALGMAALLSHQPDRAVDCLREVWEHTLREGVDEPGVFPAAPDLVEALVELGEFDEADAVTQRLHELAERQQHPWGTVTASRCRAVVRLASAQDSEPAAAAMLRAAEDYERLGLPFDRARTLLSLGRAQRRVRQWGVARSSLETATTAFEQLGSGGWAEQARLELDRVGARRPSPTGELTATERRVVDLAATGSSNKEIARALYVTVHTVEAHLSHAYAKLGVRSRGQLAGRLSTSR
jgi:DNA-binding CsgD family transcriptional regulator